MAFAKFIDDENASPSSSMRQVVAQLQQAILLDSLEGDRAPLVINKLDQKTARLEDLDDGAHLSRRKFSRRRGQCHHIQQFHNTSKPIVWPRNRTKLPTTRAQPNLAIRPPVSGSCHLGHLRCVLTSVIRPNVALGYASRCLRSSISGSHFHTFPPVTRHQLQRATLAATHQQLMQTLRSNVRTVRPSDGSRLDTQLPEEFFLRQLSCSPPSGLRPQLSALFLHSPSAKRSQTRRPVVGRASVTSGRHFIPARFSSLPLSYLAADPIRIATKIQ